MLMSYELWAWAHHNDLCDLIRENIKELEVGWNRASLILRPLRVDGEAVNECNDNIFDIDSGLKLGTSSKEGVERREVELIGKDLNDTLHEVLLSNGIPATDGLFQNARHHRLPVAKLAHKG